ncbi:MAG: DUF896 domain-containing protein [Lachnospiraceae bacterium]|nr:DUF896 domain-containing protein [Lachnospiraceae bacterium]
MNVDEMIKRINELYHKSKSDGLTDDEAKEQAELRKQYVLMVRNNLKSQLDRIDILNPDGTVTNLGQEYGKE